jgi:hypothetical protein
MEPAGRWLLLLVGASSFIRGFLRLNAAVLNPSNANSVFPDALSSRAGGLRPAIPELP